MQVSPTRTRRKFEDEPGMPHVYRMVDVTLDRLPRETGRDEVAMALMVSGAFEAASLTVRRNGKIASTMDLSECQSLLDGRDRDRMIQIFAVNGRARAEYAIESARHVRVTVSGGGVPNATSVLRRIESDLVDAREREKERMR